MEKIMRAADDVNYSTAIRETLAEGVDPCLRVELEFGARKSEPKFPPQSSDR